MGHSHLVASVRRHGRQGQTAAGSRATSRASRPRRAVRCRGRCQTDNGCRLTGRAPRHVAPSAYDASLGRPDVKVPQTKRDALSLTIAAIVVIVVAVGTAGAAYGAPSLPEVQKKAAAARAREAVLTDDVSRYNARVRAVEARLAPVQARATALVVELAQLRTRRAALTRDLRHEVARLMRLRRNLEVQRHRLSRRLSAVYRSGEPNILQLILTAQTLSDASAARDAVARVAEQDRGLIVTTISLRNQARRARDRIAATRVKVVATERRVGVAEAEAQRAVAVIAEERSRLVAATNARRALLARVTIDRRELEAEAVGLQERSAALANKIRASTPPPASPAAASPPPATSPVPAVAAGSGGGLSWPVSGPVVSPFGPRWGRMHEGIDIAAGTGTPIGSAGSGTVIVAGWSGGYGNLVVVSHGQLATAYAHMSRVSVSVGQSVGRGTTLGAVGCTGRCFGPHVHFEVRDGGSPRNPISYL